MDEQSKPKFYVGSVARSAFKADSALPKANRIAIGDSAQTGWRRGVKIYVQFFKKNQATKQVCLAKYYYII